MSLGRVLALVLSLGVLLAVLLGMVTSGREPEHLGPFTTGDGDAVVIAPRAAP